MKKLTNVSLAILLVLTMVSCGNSQNQATNESANVSQEQTKTSIAKTVSTNEFQELIKNKKDGFLLDVRTPEEVAAGAIEGSTPIDFYGKEFKQNLEKLDKNKPVLVYCAVGGRSGKSMEIMKKMGFKEIYNLSGGIRAWISDGKPVK